MSTENLPTLFSLTKAQLRAQMAAASVPTFRADQLLDWVYRKAVLHWGQMTNIGAKLQETLAQHLQLTCLEEARLTPSSDGQTFKFLWKLSSGDFVESVLICSEDRRTVCVSSQVGCPARCAFCASGKEGFFRNLTTAEIVEQVIRIQAWLAPKGEKVSHIVYMGMGEPMENYSAVVDSIRQFTDPDLLGMSERRITVSTVGVIEGIDKLAQEGLKVNLVLSLHAPNQNLRKKLIPYARKYELADILEAMDRYATATKRDITYEYTLLAGINDGETQARELVQLLRRKQCTVNLIPYNPVVGLRLERPRREVIEKFRAVLDNARIVNTCRYTKGDDISAACGQLALQHKKEGG